jgi:catechol 2,3-dioxygenase-like lactoylglutathione lyase family enzyme
MTIPLPALLHVGIVVPDMDSAATDFERRWGLKTFDQQEMTFPNSIYKGEPTTINATYGFIRSGASEVELIEPGEGVSPYSDFLAEQGEGIHHLAYIVDAIDTYLDQIRAAGHEPRLLLDAPIPEDGRFAYVEGVAVGAIVELIELPSSMKGEFPTG